MVIGVSANNVAAIIGSAEFFAPEMRISPETGGSALNNQFVQCRHNTTTLLRLLLSPLGLRIGFNGYRVYAAIRDFFV